MNLTTEMIINGILLLICVLVAGFHSKQTRVAGACLLAIFFIYICAWNEPGLRPRDFVQALTGEKLKSAWFWAAADLIGIMIICATAIEWMWAVLLMTTLTFQFSLHLLHIYDWIPASPYQSWLDKLFYIQLLIMFMTGFPAFRGVVKTMWHPVKRKMMWFWWRLRFYYQNRLV